MANGQEFSDYDINGSNVKVNRAAGVSGAIVSMGLDANPITTGTGDIAVVAPTPGLRLMGYSCKESAGSPAVARATLFLGDANTDPAALHISLAASEAKTFIFPDGGLPADDGIFLDRTSGEMTITVFTKTVVVAS